MTGTGLGWLQGTVRDRPAREVLRLLCGRLDAEAELRPMGTRWYEKSAKVGPYTLVAWEPRTRPDADEVYFDIAQRALDVLGARASLDLAAALLEFDAHFTRTDVYYDDRLRRAEPATVREAFERGDKRTHVKKISETRKFRDRGGQSGVVQDGATVYVGSPKSAVMLRVYDKEAESGQAGAGVRWEVQARGKQARELARGAVAAGEALARHALGVVCGLIDFRDRSGGDRGDRAPRLGWWEAVIEDAERVNLNPATKDDSLARRRAWIWSQVAPTLALIRIADGAERFERLLLAGERRLTDADRRLLGRSESGAS